MRILLDSNILGRCANPQDINHQVTIQSLTQLTIQGNALVYLPQNVYEFCDFAGRPLSKNGLQMSHANIKISLRLFQNFFTLLYPAGSQELWHYFALQESLQIYGSRSHDLRLVAACQALGITHILTLNPKDFQEAADAGHISILTPQSVLKPAS